MKVTAGQINRHIGGKLRGNPDLEIFSAQRIEEAQPGSIAFIGNPKYEQFLYKTNASLVVISNDLSIKREVTPSLILVDDPNQAYAEILETFFHTRAKQSGIEEPSFLSPSAIIGKNIYLGAFSYIDEGVQIGSNVMIYPQVYIGKNVKIGDSTILYPGVKIHSDSRIGKDCTIHAGAVIGSDGFGFIPHSNGTYRKIPQTGNVIIGDNVEIGANCTVDRASIGSTIIESGTKIDNLVQVAHNSSIGKNTVIAAQAGIAGSTKIGDQVMIGGQAGLVGHISIANKVKINAQSGVSKSISDEGMSVTGSPAFDIRESLKSYAAYKKLPDLLKRLETLEKILIATENSKLDK